MTSSEMMKLPYLENQLMYTTCSTTISSYENLLVVNREKEDTEHIELFLDRINGALEDIDLCSHDGLTTERKITNTDYLGIETTLENL